MKKLLVVFTAILVVAFAAPAFAADAMWSGELDFGGITAFDKADITNAWVNAYTDVTLDVDDYNDIVLEFLWQNGGFWGVGYAGLETDLGMALGLPVGLTMTGGYINIYTEKYEVTGHATERDKIRTWIGTSPMFVAAIDVAPVTIKVGVGFEQNVGTMVQDYAIYAYAPGIADMVDLEAGYFIKNNDDFQGQFMVSAKATDIMDMIGVAGGFKYDARDEEGPDGILGTADDITTAWFWGFGVKADLMDMIGLGVSAAGQEDEAFRNLNVDVNVAITDEFGIDVGLGLGFGDVLDTFGGLEPSVYYTTGASTWRLGYLYQASDVNGYLYAAPTSAPVDGSGLFLTCGLDF
jgi:hypothetical protein